MAQTLDIIPRVVSTLSGGRKNHDFDCASSAMIHTLETDPQSNISMQRLIVHRASLIQTHLIRLSLTRFYMAEGHSVSNRCHCALNAGDYMVAEIAWGDNDYRERLCYYHGISDQMTVQ